MLLEKSGVCCFKIGTAGCQAKPLGSSVFHLEVSPTKMHETPHSGHLLDSAVSRTSHFASNDLLQ